jgi:hypothetical protein
MRFVFPAGTAAPDRPGRERPGGRPAMTVMAAGAGPQSMRFPDVIVRDDRQRPRRDHPVVASALPDQAGASFQVGRHFTARRARRDTPGMGALSHDATQSRASLSRPGR